LDQKNYNFFIYVGDESAWRISLTENLWGYPNKFQNSWSKLNIGDLFAFYVTAPISKIIGFGRVSDKFIDEKLFWPDEKLFKRCLWKYKVGFERINVIENWGNGISIPSTILLKGGRIPISEEIFMKLIKDAEKSWNKKILLKPHP